MPFFQKIDNSIGLGAQLEANAGQYDVGQQQFHNSLAANADARSQQNADQASQDAADRLDLNYAQLDSQNQRFGQGLQNKIDLNQMTAQERQDLEDLKQGYQDGRLTDKGVQTMQQLQQKFENSQQLQQPKTDLGYYKADAQDARGYYNTDQRAATAAAGQAGQNQRQQNSFDFRAANPPGGALSEPQRQFSMAQRQWEAQRRYLQTQVNAIRLAFSRANKPTFLGGNPAAAAQLQQQLATFTAQLEQHMQNQPQIPQQGDGGGGDPTYYDSVENMSPDTSPGAVDPGQQSSAQPQQQSDPAAVIAQLAQQIVQEMPTASHAAQKTELMVRAQQARIA